MPEFGEWFRERINEIFQRIDVVGLTLTGFIGIVKGIYSEGVGSALCLLAAGLAFVAIALLRR